MKLVSQFFSAFMAFCLMLTIKTKRKTEHIWQEGEVGGVEYK